MEKIENKKKIRREEKQKRRRANGPVRAERIGNSHNIMWAGYFIFKIMKKTDSGIYTMERVSDRVMNQEAVDIFFKDKSDELEKIKLEAGDEWGPDEQAKWRQKFAVMPIIEIGDASQILNGGEGGSQSTGVS